MSRITVHMAKFTNTCALSSHIVLVLEQTLNNETFYFPINTALPSDDPITKPAKLDTDMNKRVYSNPEYRDYMYCMDIIEHAEKKCDVFKFCSYITFPIEGNIHIIARECRNYQTENPFNLCSQNCGDLVEWFLEKYANVAKSRSPEAPKNFDCSLVALCICLPNFLQCCTLPGRVMSNTTASLIGRHNLLKGHSKFSPLIVDGQTSPAHKMI